MRQARRPSMLRELLELPLRLIFAICVVLVQVILLVRRILPASLVLLLCALLPLLGFSLRLLEGMGSWLMLAAALMLAFAAGALRNRR
jgi:uncharacterized membrane protein YoaK (UPF0700 family)